MFDQTIKRLGFACKYMHSDRSLKPKVLREIEQPFNGRATTRAWLDRQSPKVSQARLIDIVRHNITAFYNLLNYVSTLPPQLRMVRLGSDVLPMYTEAKWRSFYHDAEIINEIQQSLAAVGDFARHHDIRISMHPGQFTVLASDRPEVVENSIDEFEYHADVARWMGYGQSFMDMKINVHISGRLGPAGIRSILPRLSQEARNTISIENEEMAWGLDSTLELANDVALVLDIHHHFVKTSEYIQANDDRFKRIIDSWRGVRPTIHYSVSRKDLLVDHPVDHLPDMKMLLESGYKKGKLRAHSDMFWNRACNDWALTFWDHADIMTESKFKNLASLDLYAYALKK